ncbi:serine hydrolase [Streptomyces sp. RO-S4]|uniref:serine hydrolase n=2 Tax=unclassified Streptomyces TaxID=2593676 RepID=UPI0027E22C03|nr:serine hydrolase [Streptomyces sp. RO-S4]
MITRRSMLSTAFLTLAGASLPTAAAATPESSDTARSLERDADALRDAGVTGVAVRPDTPRGTVTARSGVANLVTRRPVPEGGFLRLGSTTKTFVATVLLQLVGERRVSLDRTVEELLPRVAAAPPIRTPRPARSRRSATSATTPSAVETDTGTAPVTLAG